MYQQILVKIPNISFRENTAGGSLVFPRRQTNMTLLRVAFRNCFERPPKEYRKLTTVINVNCIKILIRTKVKYKRQLHGGN
jgi:hypothetical protein